MHLSDYPLCAACERRGLVVAGNQVDHIVPHKLDLDLLTDRANLQTLCEECHGIKSSCELRGDDCRETFPERRLIE